VLPRVWLTLGLRTDGDLGVPHRPRRRAHPLTARLAHALGRRAPDAARGTVSRRAG